LSSLFKELKSRVIVVKVKNCTAFPQKEISWKKKNNKEIHFACQDYCSRKEGKGRNI